jgi:superfamily I DNA/RNA helicase
MGASGRYGRLAAVQLTGEQEAVVAFGSGPARVVGGFGTGKTAALRARAERLSAAGVRVLMIGRPAEFVGLALAIVARHRGARRLLGGDEQRELVASLAESAGRDPVYVAELADTVCLYQASYLGEEELRTHAAAAGPEMAERWEELAAFTHDYLAALEERGATDWAGALVDAGLLLRDPEVNAAERDRFDHVIVDQFENASFASNRLLSLLTGPHVDVVVAGNADAGIAGRVGGTSRYLERFCAAFGASDLRLSRRLSPTPEVETITVAGVAQALRGEDRSDVAVIGRGEDLDIDGVNVTSVDEAAGRYWPVVVLTDVPALTFEPPRYFDRELLNGPDVPSEEQQRGAWAAEERRRFEVAKSRATRRLILVS